MKRPHNYIHAHLSRYMIKYGEAVKYEGKTFLLGKGQTLQDYIDYMKQLGNKGDELSLHLCAHMCQKQVAVITKINFYYTGKLNNSCDDFIQISDCDMVLVYLEKDVFHGTKENPFCTGPYQTRPGLDQKQMMSMNHQGCQCMTRKLNLRGVLHGPWGHHHWLNHLCTPWLSPLRQRELRIHLQPLPQKGNNAHNCQKKSSSRKKEYKRRRGSQHCHKQCTLCHKYFDSQKE